MLPTKLHKKRSLPFQEFFICDNDDLFSADGEERRRKEEGEKKDTQEEHAFFERKTQDFLLIHLLFSFRPKDGVLLPTEKKEDLK